jgi:DNA-directed RNA polymerase specialized sigma24 family protein
MVDTMETKTTSHTRLYAATFAAQDLAALRDELDPLKRIQSLNAALANVESSLAAEMVAAQEAGLSWQQIGEAVGITRQAAQQRAARLRMRYGG